MKKLAITTLACLVLAPLTAFSQSFIGNIDPNEGDTGVFGFWNFNSGASATTGTFSAATLAPTFGTGTLAFSGTDGITVFGGTVTNLPSPDPDGTGRGVALAIQGGTDLVNNGSNLTFALNMTNLSDLSFSFAGQRTATGFDSINVSYSLGGSSFVSFGNIAELSTSMGTTTAVPASIRTVDFSSVAGFTNNNDVRVQLTFDGASQSGGNNRFDNFQFEATVIPEPSVVLVFGLGLAFILWRIHVRRVNA